MAQRTVAQTMGSEEGSRAHLVGAPDTALTELGLPKHELPGSLSGSFDYLHLYVLSQKELTQSFAECRDHLNPGGKLWVSWPKYDRYDTDLTIKRAVAIGYELGMVERVSVRVDEDWAGIEFSCPKRGKAYRNGTQPRQWTTAEAN